jgi:hypothetical protein
MKQLWKNLCEWRRHTLARPVPMRPEARSPHPPNKRRLEQLLVDLEQIRHELDRYVDTVQGVAEAQSFLRLALLQVKVISPKSARQAAPGLRHFEERE